MFHRYGDDRRRHLDELGWVQDTHTTPVRSSSCLLVERGTVRLAHTNRVRRYLLGALGYLQ